MPLTQLVQEPWSAQYQIEKTLSLVTGNYTGIYGNIHFLSIERSEEQLLRERVFADLWKEGYYMTSGLKYGGDFLVYSADPSSSHSAYIAVVVSWKQHLSCLTALARVATKVKKKILLCSAEDDQISYITLEWAGVS